MSVSQRPPLNLLTWNGITKYYTDGILMDSSDDVSNLQWHRFQLVWMVEKSGGNARDKVTGNVLSRSILGNWIMQQQRFRRYNEYPLEGEELQEAERIGLVPEYDRGRDFWDGFGGFPKQKIVIDPSRSDVIFSRDNFYQKGIRIPTLVDTADDISQLTFVAKTPSPGESKEGVIGTAPKHNPCIRGGLIYYENKCYLDTALTLLLTESPENKFREIMMQSATQLEETQDTPQSQVAKQLLSVGQHLSEGRIFQARDFVNALKEVPGNQDFANNQPHNILEFMEKLFYLLRIRTIGYNFREEMLSGKKKRGKKMSDVTSFSRLHRSLPTATTLYRRTHVLVSEMESSTGFVFSSPPISLSTLKIDPSQNHNLSELLSYQYDTPLEVKPPYYGVIGIDGWEYSPDTKTLRLGEITYPISDLSYDQKKHTLSLDGKIIAETGYKRSILTQTIQEAKYLILNIGRASVVEDDTGEAATQIINGAPYYQALINEVKITPEQVLRLQDGELRLTAIITFKGDDVFYGHYFGFYCCRGTWYKYDDMNKGKIVEIGNYQELLDYDDQFVVRRGMSFFYC